MFYYLLITNAKTRQHLPITFSSDGSQQQATYFLISSNGKFRLLA